jgi:hypothetical protein
MREITILQEAMQEARRIMREASTIIAGESLSARTRRIIDANKLANDVLLKARAESRLAVAAAEFRINETLAVNPFGK